MSISLLVIILKNFTRSIEGSLVFELFVFVFKMSRFLIINVIYWYSVLSFWAHFYAGRASTSTSQCILAIDVLFSLEKLIQISSFCSNYSTRIGIKKETDNRRWNSFMIGRYFITVNHFYHTILESGSNYSMPRVWNSIDRWFKERYARKGLYMDYIWAIYGLYMDYIWTIYGTIYGPFSKKSSEKDLNVRISLRTKAQSIPEGLGHNLALGAKIKNNYEKFFYDPLYAKVERPIFYFILNDLCAKQTF